MPIYSDNTPENALMNAKRIMEAGAHAIKIEGNKPEVIRTVLDAGIPVMGHLGLLPQTAENYRVKGKQPEEADRIFNDALELDGLGVFCMVIECIPESLARKITEAVRVPTIGAGAGKYCDGQNINLADILGMDDSWAPKFVKRYANLNKAIKEAIAVFKREVLTEAYPDEEHTYH
jgi:3-methyl-2-oxobutanoate hydroxymethyltransferase